MTEEVRTDPELEQLRNEADNHIGAKQVSRHDKGSGQQQERCAVQALGSNGLGLF